MAGGSTTVVLFELGANLGIAVAKFAAAVSTTDQNGISSSSDLSKLPPPPDGLPLPPPRGLSS